MSLAIELSRFSHLSSFDSTFSFSRLICSMIERLPSTTAIFDSKAQPYQTLLSITRQLKTDLSLLSKRFKISQHLHKPLRNHRFLFLRLFLTLRLGDAACHRFGIINDLKITLKKLCGLVRRHQAINQAKLFVTKTQTLKFWKPET